MIRILIKIILRVTLLLTLTVLTLSALYMYSLRHAKLKTYRHEQFIYNQLYERADSIIIITLGHSHCRDIEFEALGYGLSGYHTYQGAQDIFESNYTLQQIYPHLPNLKIILYPISFFIHRENKHVKKKRTQLYSSFPKGLWIKGDILNWIKAKLYYLNNLKWNSTGEITENSNEIYQITKTGLRTQKVLYRTISYEELVKISKAQYKQHINIVRTCEKKNKNLYKETTQEFEKLIEFCNSKDIRLIFYTPPYFFKYTELFPIDIREKTNETVDYLSDKYKIEYYNFCCVDSLIHTDSLFYDDDHLNQSIGNKVFSKILKVKIDENSSIIE